jgi:hypothetical protein
VDKQKAFEKQCFLGWLMGCTFADCVGIAGNVPWQNLALGNSGALVVTAIVCLLLRKAKD